MKFQCIIVDCINQGKLFWLIIACCGCRSAGNPPQSLSTKKHPVVAELLQATHNNPCGCRRAAVLPPHSQQSCLQPHALRCAQQGTGTPRAMPHCSLCNTAFISGEFPSLVCFAVLYGHTHKHWSAPACMTTLLLKFSPLRLQQWGSWSRDAGSLNSTGTVWGGKQVCWQNWWLLCGEPTLPNSTLTAR